MDTPLVSIFTLAYNHAPFIRQCLDGILMQKTTFLFELIVHDDASTDETADIIREYAARYPDIIKPVYETENQFSKSDADFHLPEPQGKYTAWCEGDDYWTDPLKLQKQVDFLETHPDYTICGGMCWIHKDGITEPPIEMKKISKGKTVTLQDYLDPHILYWLTVCYRNNSWKEERLDQFKRGIDIICYAILLEQGKGFVLPDYFGVYRMHQGGIWAGNNYEQRLRFNEKYCYELVMHFGNKSKSIRKKYFKNSIDLRFFELKTSQHIFSDGMKIVRFTFSGSIKDIISFQIRYFFHMAKKSFKAYCKKRFN